MELALTLVSVLAISVAVATLADKWSLSPPLLLIGAGIAGSYLPFVPDVELTPELVLFGLLPPLLYSAAMNTSLLDFRANRRPIMLLSVGAVLFTAAGVGYLVHWLLDVPLAVGIALGAVVAPPDAVAATAIARRSGMPRRVVTILEGESLVNDATSIVTLRTAITAIAGSVAALEVATSFLLSAIGGIAVGVVVAFVIGKIRGRLPTVPNVAFSLLTPWLAYLPAEEIRIPGVDGAPSGVLAVVTAGLIISHRSPIKQSGVSRVMDATNWATLAFMLENAVFFLIGLQCRSILNAVLNSDVSLSKIVWVSLAVLTAVIGLRLIWVFVTMYAPRRTSLFESHEFATTGRETFVVGWAGMRGVVTLAAAFLLPPETPHRDVLLMIAFVVTLGTLVLQGLTLPHLMAWLGVPPPDRSEDQRLAATIYQDVVGSGLAYIDSLGDDVDPQVTTRLRQRAMDRSSALWERLDGPDSPSQQYMRLRAAMLDVERKRLLQIRDSGEADQQILRSVLHALDVEETILNKIAEDESTSGDDRRTTG